MKRLFILEGPDKAGKTTLGKALARRTGGVYLHQSGDARLHSQMEAYHQAMVICARDNLELERDVIMDRLWLSEMIYHKITRPNLDACYDVGFFRSWAKEHHALNIFCLPTNSGFAENLKSGDVHPDLYKMIADRYQEQFAALVLIDPACYIYNREYWINRECDAVEAILKFYEYLP